MPEMDDEDQEILRERMEALDLVEGPRVGDFVYLRGEDEPRRFTYDWEHSIQTTSIGFGESFYLGEGYVSFSGGLDPSILKSSLVQLNEKRVGAVWFFHHNWTKAHNGVDATAEFRVFKQK